MRDDRGEVGRPGMEEEEEETEEGGNGGGWREAHWEPAHGRSCKVTLISNCSLKMPRFFHQDQTFETPLSCVIPFLPGN